MRVTKCLAIFAVIAGLSFFAPSPARAQVFFGLNTGPQPVCPYGYYDYAPYNCAPYGYYGSEWSQNGFFSGAGPWFHENRDWRGDVDNRYDPRRGNRGEFPHRGEHGNFHAYDHGHEFHGNEMRGDYRDRGGHGGHSH